MPILETTGLYKMKNKRLWYRAASKEYPLGLWKNLPADMEEENIILRNSQTGKVRCAFHCDWEDYTLEDEFSVKCSCGKISHGLIIPWVPQKELTKIEQNHGLIILTKENASWRQEEKSRIIQLNQNERKIYLDDEGVCYDVFLYALETDYEECTAFFRRRSIDRKKIISKDSLKVPDLHWACSVYLKGRKSKARDGSTKTLFTAFPDHNHNEEEFIIPSLIHQEIEKTTEELVESFAGRKIALNKNLYRGLDLMRAAAIFPYEVNVTTVAEEMGFMKSIESDNPWLDRSNPDIYNELCGKLGLKTFTKLRKIFDKNPHVLIWYKNLSDMGFKDINVISDILCLFDKTVKINEYKDMKNYNGWIYSYEYRELREKAVSKMKTTFFECIDKYLLFEESENPYIFFCDYSIRLRGERATWRALNRQPVLGKYEMEDIASQFSRFFKELKPEEREMVLKQGFTVNVHNTLSNIVRNLKEENQSFIYTEAQKKLEDEIDGYKFILPVDSNTMHTLGAVMHNCVFSYWERVFEGKCTIVYAMLNDQYKACIEVSNKRVIKQARSDYNERLDEETEKAFDKWRKKKKLISGSY